MLGIEVYVRRYLGLKKKFSAQRKNFHLNYTYMYNWTQTYMYYSFFCSKQIVSNVIPYGFCKKKKKSSLLVDPPHSFFCIYFPFLTPHFTHFPLVRSRAPCYFLLCILVNGPFLFLRYLKLRQDIYWHLKIWSLESLVKGNMWYLSFWVSTLNMIDQILHIWCESKTQKDIARGQNHKRGEKRWTHVVEKQMRPRNREMCTRKWLKDTTHFCTNLKENITRKSGANMIHVYILSTQKKTKIKWLLVLIDGIFTMKFLPTKNTEHCTKIKQVCSRSGEMT